MRDIDDHPDAVHLGDDFLAERGKSVVGLVGIARGIGPVVAVVVGKRHIPDAERIKVAQQAGAVFDGMAAFNAEQGGDLVFAARAADAGNADGVEEIIGVTVDDVVPHGVDHLQCAVGGMIAVHVAGGHVDGEHLRAHSTGLHARDIGHVVRVGFADVHAGDRGRGDVVVGVDEESAFVDALHFGVGDGALLPAWGLGGEDSAGEGRGDREAKQRKGHVMKSSMALRPLSYRRRKSRKRPISMGGPMPWMASLRGLPAQSGQKTAQGRSAIRTPGIEWKKRTRTTFEQQRHERIFELVLGDVHRDHPAAGARHAIDGFHVRCAIVPLRHVVEVVVFARRDE